MEIKLDKKLFWFLKQKSQLDLSDPSSMEMYVQQVLSKGRTKDVKSLLTRIEFARFQEVFLKIKRFLTWEVRSFWEDFIEHHQQHSGTNP